MYLLSIFLWLVLPNSYTLNFSITISALTLTILIILKDKNKYQKLFKSYFFKKLSESFVYGFLIFCIFALGNYLVFQFPKQLDLTKDKMNSLSGQTVEIVKKISSPLEGTIIANPQMATQIKPLIELYRLENPLISYVILDPDLNPEKVRSLGVENRATLLLNYDGRTRKITAFNEKSISSAIANLILKRKTVIYVPAGHRKKLEIDNDSRGFSRFVRLLKEEGFEINEINLLEVKEIPQPVDENSFLLIIGPKLGFVDKELETISKYLDSGSPAGLVLDPQFRGDIFENLRDLFADKRGITISNDLVVDSIKNIRESGGSIPVVEKFEGNHPITKGFQDNVIFPLVSSVQIIESSESPWEGTRLAKTSLFPASWGERDFKQVSSSRVTFDDGIDLKGPITLAGVSESKTRNNGRTIVFGSSVMFSNAYFNIPSNFDLFLNSLRWSLDQGALISFERPSRDNERVVLNQISMDVVFYFSVVLMPILMFIMAFFFHRKKSSEAF